MSPPAGQLTLRGRCELGDTPVDAAWAPDGRSLVAACGAGALLRVTVGPALETSPIGSHAGGALAVAWQRAGNAFASTGQDGAVLLWDARSLEPRPIHTGRQWSGPLAFSDNGRWLAVASGRTLRAFDATGVLHASFESHAGTIAALAWRPRSTELAAAGNGGMRLHRIEPQPGARDYPWKGACLSARWNPDGRILAAGMQDGSVHLWYVAGGTESQMQGYGSKVFATEWTANGRYLITAAGSALVVWDFGAKGPEGTAPLELQAHSERISAIACRPTGTWAVSAARDRRLLLWRIGASTSPQDAHLLADECTLLRFTRGGERLAVGDAQGGLTVFDC